MEIFKIEEFVKAAVENPDSESRYRQFIVTSEQKAENLGGLFVRLLPGQQVPYHYHNKRESVIIPISGEAIETIEGKEYTIKVNDILFVPAGEKHGMVNKSNKEFRFIEFFTGPADVDDRVEIAGE
jgi:quercetin dioxygenase-like cupin family protein